MIKWHVVSSDTYKNGTKYEDHVYFLTDTHEIYRGSQSYSDSATIVNEFPTEGIKKNHLYIKQNTFEGKIYNGSTWIRVLPSIDMKQDKAIGAMVTITPSDWQGGTICTKSVPSVTASSIVIVDTSDSNIECVGQGTGILTFCAINTPTTAVMAKVVIL